MVHIRSGQFWGNCNEEEASAYLDNLEPKLRGGLLYLWNFPEESGSLGVRYLRNINATLDFSPSLEGKNSEKGGETDTDTFIANSRDTYPKETSGEMGVETPVSSGYSCGSCESWSTIRGRAAV
ncbi:hem-containing dehydratase protein [Penicillium waksmanii]|uniref:hem-containing dehydratase protein n=1 Tax=Penicillium waksmanii TaxID=69791 RepID=UPI0025495BEC|nr:hem-containing dehydratase protein [Penicillium waksmanii]KAJ5966433.1 hem-containing dehydratase protein [Penicillium waksmanii]